MTRHVFDPLTARFDSVEVRRKLHDVPPHEVYEVRVDGRHCVYKADTGPAGTAGTEGRVIAFVGDRTSLPVPDILHLGPDNFLAAWMQDAPAPAGDHEATETWARAAGRSLGKLHEETGPAIEAFGEMRPGSDGIQVSGHETWQAAARAFVRRRRTFLAGRGHADVADAVLGFLENHPGAFEGCGKPVCCHGWATPAHVSVTDGEVTAIVDFEHAIAAPGEFDYWRTVLPTFEGTDDRRAMAFRQGYESIRALPAGVHKRGALYVMLNGIAYLESLYVQDRHGPAETRRRVDRLRTDIRRRLDELR